MADLEATVTQTETASAEAETEAGSSSDPSRYLSSPAAPGAGATIGRYRVESVLGRGGEGIVLAAYDPRLDRHVALKLLRAEHRGQHVRLLNEGQSIARLRHPNVITVYDVGEHGDDLFIAMELVRGASLRTWLAKRRPWREALAVVVDAGRGLAAAHAAGLVHGDVKPENILVADDGHVVIGDFGLARPNTRESAAGEPENSGGMTGGLAGTPAYLAPELWRGRPSTAASDQFALAVTLYEAVYGVRPFDGGRTLSFTELAEVVQAGRRAPTPSTRVPRRIARALDRALSLDSQARFPSVTAFLDELAPWSPSSDGRHGRSETGTKRRWLAPTVLALVAAGVAIAFVVTRVPDRDDARAVTCTRAAARVDTVWNDAERTTYRQRHAGAPWLDEQLGWLDGFSRAWSSARLAVCNGSATLARTEPDAAAACLDRGLDSLAAAAVDSAGTWPELPDLRDCLSPPVQRPQSRSFVFGPQGYPVLSPDAREVAMTTYSGDAYVAALDAPIAPRPIAGAYEILDWLDDGTRYVASRDHHYQLVAPDGTITPVGQFDEFVPRGSQVSPDRRYASFEIGGHIEVRAVTTGEVVGTIDGSPAYTTWEPDSHRLAVSLPDRIVLFAPTKRERVEVPLRVPLGPEGIRDASWLRPGELLVAGQVHGERRGGLWSIDVDDDGHLRRAPSLRLVPEPATSLMPNDHRGDRLTAKVFSAKQRTFSWRAGAARELRSTLDYADVIAFDAASGRAMSMRERELLVYTVDGASSPTTITVEPGTYAFRAGAISSLRADGPGHWSLVDVALDEATRVVAHLAWDAGTPALVCDHASAGHCALVGERGGLVVAASLEGTTLGREIALPGMRGGIAVSPDGTRWLSVHDTDDVVVEIDARTGRIVAEHAAAEPDCYTFGAGWRAGRPGIWARYACADRFALVRGPVDGARYEPILESDGWMSGVVSFGDDEYLYSVQDNDGALLVIDGM